MIGRIQGTLLSKHPPSLLIDCQGIGYDVDVPMSTFYQLPNIGEKTTLLTHFVVKEDAHMLYGFISEDERSTFRKLIKINGIGPRMGLSILSGMNVDELAHAIASQEPAKLTRIPGIGKKIAERLILELKDKLTTNSLIHSQLSAKSTLNEDILHALLALGYSEKEALSSMKSIPEDSNVSNGIKFALKFLTKA